MCKSVSYQRSSRFRAGGHVEVADAQRCHHEKEGQVGAGELEAALEDQRGGHGRQPWDKAYAESWIDSFLWDIRQATWGWVKIESPGDGRF